jgi:vacuolar-type H+-ATPase subunit H
VSPKDRPLRRSSLEATTSERLAAIVEAAERAASQVIDDAEREGRRYLSDAQAEADRIVAERLARLAELTDSLVAQAESIRLQSERLLGSLEEARGEIDADPGDSTEATAPPRVAHLSAVAPVAAPEDAGDADRDAPAGARLLATQMAVSGNSREEIEARLRNGFEIDDTDAILDAILGPEE